VAEPEAAEPEPAAPVAEAEPEVVVGEAGLADIAFDTRIATQVWLASLGTPVRGEGSANPRPLVLSLANPIAHARAQPSAAVPCA
jgi:hypothetical protein